ncbi:type I restriction endonuclease subunit R [Butyrivibrio sp. MB2005]|uniref:type I restriction endonuclease subunit R n=1 Tax=Butyrivibrio sp. MB2005 TaxID=1280678 RepID=UPI00040AF945|nr:DEAD/DEAH box helicase family protein [Butyrivibrio sp. MB2005]
MDIELLKSKLKGLSKAEDIVDRAKEYRNLLGDVIAYVFDEYEVDVPKTATMLELLDNRIILEYFGEMDVIQGLHFVRKLGKNAEHGKNIRKKDIKVAEENMATIIGYIVDKESGKSERSCKASFMSEAETRHIYIDAYLQEAGWDVLEKDNLIQPGKACIEIYVEGMPNNKQEGYCDYVLYGRDGRPLAVVEAKRTSVSIETGRHQVDLYGDCLQKKYGYKPVLYYTNGYFTRMIDGIYPDRDVYAYHSIDELELILQKRQRTAIADFTIRDEITNRAYQKMAITAMCERLNGKKRRGLLAMATGTGKTRIAISLVDVLTRNNWVKNVLFLADRVPLVNQAKRDFAKYLNQTICVLSDKEKKEFNARIMFSTYQTMINYIDAEDKRFGTGRFDLIIIDEAHRSVFNKYGAIFKYFDSFLVGLTATPRGEVGHSTYQLLECEQDEPTYDYSTELAIKEKYLVGYEVINKESLFIRNGISYEKLSEDAREQLDTYFGGQIPDSKYIIPKSEIFRKLYNENTCEQVLQELMNSGLRINNGETIGKTIIFAYDHHHADMIVKCFGRLYPQYDSNTCQLVDDKVKYAHDLIIKFEEDDAFRIAVSVEMLDTGIDVTSVLNLVFFKPVYSKIRFLQMIGRGTRLCPNLYGPGKHKSGFLIFDYCGNFEFFGENPEGRILDRPTESVTQKLFYTRCEILHDLQRIEYQENAESKKYYEALKAQLHQDVTVVRSHDNRISVREKMQYVDKYSKIDEWQSLSPVSLKQLKANIAPLLDSGLNDESIVLLFDLRMLRVEASILAMGTIAKVAKDVKNIRLMAQHLLREKASIPEVLNKAAELKKIVSDQFWEKPGVMEVENMRVSLRDIMKNLKTEKEPPYDIDIKDTITDSDYKVDSTAIDIRTYREKVIDYLMDHIDNEVIKKIHNLEKINNDDLKELERILWEELGTQEEYEETTDIHNLAAFVRSLIGLSQEAVNEKFGEYLSGNVLTLQQQEFVHMIINYVRENGDIELSDMVNTEPFSDIDLNDMFGENLPMMITIVNVLHSAVAA